MKVLIDELTQLKLHGMAQCATELLAQSKPPTWQTALQKLIDTEKNRTGHSSYSLSNPSGALPSSQRLYRL